ncbi:Lysophospholipase L1 [Lachnospiraceae bacterium NK3A20]|nr:Lysophospholipase L1 [Lachnospiraceae bacterium NK3A20]
MVKDMQTIEKEQLARLHWHGRTCYDEEEGNVYFDWTCCSFECRFKGTVLLAGFHMIPGKTQVKVPSKDPMQMELADIDDYPWMAVFVDGEEQPRYTFDIRQKNQDYILWSGKCAEEHTIRVMKLSEAQFSSIALHSLSTDGDFLKAPECHRQQIEFIGDSITCGFGNMSTEADRLFFNNEENGWLAYGSVAARELGMEPAFVCYSGISIRHHEVMAKYGILDLYEYADRGLQDAKGQEPEKWNFSLRQSSIVVINLGTNDRNAVAWSEGTYTEADFRKDYEKLIGIVRDCNPDALIICALGSMDYYLFDSIAAVVDQYKMNNKDSKITTFKFTSMMNIGADVGGCMHPSKFKHAGMGRELAEFIKKIRE